MDVRRINMQMVTARVQKTEADCRLELSRSIELNPSSPGRDGSAVTYRNRGWAYEQAGRIEDAPRDYDDGHDA